MSDKNEQRIQQCFEELQDIFGANNVSRGTSYRKPAIIIESTAFAGIDDVSMKLNNHVHDGCGAKLGAYLDVQKPGKPLAIWESNLVSDGVYEALHSFMLEKPKVVVARTSITTAYSSTKREEPIVRLSTDAGLEALKAATGANWETVNIGCIVAYRPIDERYRIEKLIDKVRQDLKHDHESAPKLKAPDGGWAIPVNHMDSANVKTLLADASHLHNVVSSITH